MRMQKVNCGVPDVGQWTLALAITSQQSSDDILILLIVVSSHNAVMSVFENRNCTAGEILWGNGEERIMGLI